MAFMFWQLLLCGCLGPWLRAILRLVSDKSRMPGAVPATIVQDKAPLPPGPQFPYPQGCTQINSEVQGSQQGCRVTPEVIVG